MMQHLASLLVLAAGIALTAPGPAAAQWLPGKPVKLVVPFPPGGSADILARLVTQRISETTGQQFVLENRPGGGTVIATELVSRAPPDGGTLLLMANSFVINPALKDKLPYDPAKAFEPVCLMAHSPHIVVVNSKSPHKTFADLRAVAAARPGSVNIGALAPATAQHIAVEMLKRAAGIELTLVPFTGGAPAVTTLVGGHLDSVLANYSEVREHLGGSLRGLLVGVQKRLDAIPDVPTFAEAGYGDVISTAWFGISVPTGTSKAHTGGMAAAITTALSDKEVQRKVEAAGFVPDPVCGADFAAHIARQSSRYTTVIRESGIKE